MPIKVGALRRLRSVLQPSLLQRHTTEQDLQLPSFQVDIDKSPLEDIHLATAFGQAARSVLFFHVVRCSPKKVVRVVAEGEAGFDVSDVVIAPHRVLHADAGHREIIVDSSSLDWVSQGNKEPFILSLEVFSCEDLLYMCKWTTHQRLAHGLWGTEMSVRLPLEGADDVSCMLEELVSKHGDRGYQLDARSDKAPSGKIAFLLQAAGLLRLVSEDVRFSTWELLEKGQAVIKAGFRVSRPTQALAIRNDVDVADRTVWELIRTLDERGWTHMIMNKGKQEAHVPGSTNMLWYTKPGDETISHWYLLALLQGTVEVPHWQSSAFYQALVEGKAPARRRVPRQTLARRCR